MRKIFGLLRKGIQRYGSKALIYVLSGVIHIVAPITGGISRTEMMLIEWKANLSRWRRERFGNN